MTLLEGGEMLLESVYCFNHTLKLFQPFAFAADQVVKLTDGRADVHGFHIMTRLDVCKGESQNCRNADVYDLWLTRRGGVCD